MQNNSFNVYKFASKKMKTTKLKIKANLTYIYNETNK